MPAAVIAIGLPLLLYLSGGTQQPVHYAVLLVSILAMSVFFSVHTLALYYLLQPYNVEMETKNAAYGILNSGNLLRMLFFHGQGNPRAFLWSGRFGVLHSLHGRGASACVPAGPQNLPVEGIRMSACG